MLRQDLRRLAVTTDGEGFTSLSELLQLVVLQSSCSQADTSEQGLAIGVTAPVNAVHIKQIKP